MEKGQGLVANAVGKTSRKEQKKEKFMQFVSALYSLSDSMPTFFDMANKQKKPKPLWCWRFSYLLIARGQL